MKRTHKSDQKDIGTTSIGSIVAIDFQSLGYFITIESAFLNRLSTLKSYNLARISPIHLIHRPISFRFSFLSSFQLQDLFLK